MGKASAAMGFLKEYLRIVERVHLRSSTLHLDKGYEEIMELIKKKYKEEDVDIDDPEENPFHEDLTPLKNHAWHGEAHPRSARARSTPPGATRSRRSPSI